MRAEVLLERTHPDTGKEQVFIAYDNWQHGYDEWLSKDSKRLQPWIAPYKEAQEIAASEVWTCTEEVLRDEQDKFFNLN